MSFDKIKRFGTEAAGVVWRRMPREDQGIKVNGMKVNTLPWRWSQRSRAKGKVLSATRRLATDRLHLRGSWLGAFCRD